MKRILFTTAACLFISLTCFSQNISFVRGMIDTLCSQEFSGRGYVNSGEKKAADFIAGKLKKFHIKTFQGSYFQSFTLSINTLPGDIELKINGKTLMPGTDYCIDPDVSTVDTSFANSLLLNEKTLKSAGKRKKFQAGDYRGRMFVIDTGFKDLNNAKLGEASMLLKIKDNTVSWRVSRAQKQNRQVVVTVKRSALPAKIENVEIKAEAQIEKQYPVENVIGFLPGKACADTFIVIGAHFDHLGMMGNKTYYPGANDNASGTAMVLDLARYFSDSANMPKYSIAFILFTGEEAGLLGSQYYTEHPLFPLKNIKFMLNLDMMGTGSDGIKVVNGTIFKKDFELLKSLNEQHNYVKTVSERSETSNSDHYYFYKNGVKSFFIYTLGDEYKEYHTPTDQAAGLPLTKYNEVFKLMVDFINHL